MSMLLSKGSLKEALDILDCKTVGNQNLFLHYNTYNQMFKGTDDYYYHNVHFTNIDTGRDSYFFEEGSLYFFPTGNQRIESNNNLTAFNRFQIIQWGVKINR